MNETTKVLIGTLSGFIIAFAAEPIKIYFQNRVRLRNIRLAIYKEMMQNYLYLHKAVFGLASNIIIPGVGRNIPVFEGHVRTEFYTQVISTQLDSFYQLDEAHIFHELYSILSRVKKLAAKRHHELEEHFSTKKLSDALINACKEFVLTVALYSYLGNIDKKIIKRIVSKEDYTILINKGKDMTKKD